MNKKKRFSFENLMWVLLGILILVSLVVGIATASLTDIKVEVCNSINITDPNCTIWWDDLNLTDLNFTEITVEYVTQEYDYSNTTTYKNYTVINSSDLDMDYLNDKFPTKTHLTNQLNLYAKKGEVETQTINNTIIQPTETSGFSWWNVFSLVEFVFILAGAYVLIKVVREIEYIEGEE